MIASRMFVVPAFSLLSAIAVIGSLSLSRLPATSASPEFPLPASGLSFGQKSGEQKSAKPHESAKPHKMSTFRNGATTLVK
jgi:hypothetical protein